MITRRFRVCTTLIIATLLTLVGCTSTTKNTSKEETTEKKVVEKMAEKSTEATTIEEVTTEEETTEWLGDTNVNPEEYEVIEKETIIPNEETGKKLAGVVIEPGQSLVINDYFCPNNDGLDDLCRGDFLCNICRMTGCNVPDEYNVYFDGVERYIIPENANPVFVNNTGRTIVFGNNVDSYKKKYFSINVYMKKS